MTILFLSISFGFGDNLSNELMNIFNLKNPSSNTKVDKEFITKCGEEALNGSNEVMNCMNYFVSKMKEMSADDQVCCTV